MRGLGLMDRKKRLNPLPFDPSTNNEPLQFNNSNGPLASECPLESSPENGSKKRKRPNLPPGRCGLEFYKLFMCLNVASVTYGFMPMVKIRIMKKSLEFSFSDTNKSEMGHCGTVAVRSRMCRSKAASVIKASQALI
ncbi:ecto-NOX disulfide-thiol exchanger 2 isoform X1 [Tachysurus ichikawai]